VNKITVNGLGYVGLPLAIHFATRGFSVNGIDKDKLKIDQLSKGISYIPDVTDTHLQEAVSKGTFTAFTPEEAFPLLKEVSHVMVAVPTPLTELENLDLRDIIDATDRIQNLAKNIVDTRRMLCSLGLEEKQKPSSFAESQPNEFVVNKTDEKPRNKINEKPLVIADEKSNSKMRRVVMYTAITNNYDILKEVNYPSPDIDYIAFTDNKDLKSKTWKIIYLENLVMDSHIKTVKYYKMLPHIFLPHYQYSIWIDGSMKIRQDIQPLLEQLYQYPLTVFKHPERNCIYQEMEACRMWNLDNEFTMRKQMDLYRSKGYPKDNGLISSGVLLRQHNHPHVIKVMEDWWEEIFSHSKRDQLSFNFVAWKNGIDYQTLRWQDLINYFRIYPHIGKR
jgi:hypothetical protein